jgi:hypothetical protein
MTEPQEEGIVRGVIIGGLVGMAAAVAGVAGWADAQGPRATGQERVAVGPDLLALSHDGGDGRQQITIVDPRQRVIAVYHVERATGALQLKSVRNIHWDLLIEDYNSGSPAPRDIRALNDQQR